MSLSRSSTPTRDSPLVVCCSTKARTRRFQVTELDHVLANHTESPRGGSASISHSRKGRGTFHGMGRARPTEHAPGARQGKARLRRDAWSHMYTCTQYAEAHALTRMPECAHTCNDTHHAITIVRTHRHMCTSVHTHVPMTRTACARPPQAVTCQPTCSCARLRQHRDAVFHVTRVCTPPVVCALGTRALASASACPHVRTRTHPREARAGNRNTSDLFLSKEPPVSSCHEVASWTRGGIASSTAGKRKQNTAAPARTCDPGHPEEGAPAVCHHDQFQLQETPGWPRGRQSVTP